MKTNSDLSFTLYEILNESLLVLTQKRRPLRKGFENIKAHLKLSFVRDKYIPGADPGFQVRGEGAHLKKITPSGGRRENV